jgi:TrmH family RNA methyltransferase
MISIDSVSNERIKSAVKIASSAKTRRQTGMFFLEGLRLCRDAAVTGYHIDSFFVSARAYERFKDDADFIAERSKSSFVVSELVENKLALTQTSQGFFCLCRMKDDVDISEVDFNGKYIALENLQDPANLGAVCRTAEALGISGVIAEGGCDIYSPKAQRAAMGSLLRLPVFRCDDLAETISFLGENGINARKYFYPLVSANKEFGEDLTSLTPLAKEYSENILCLPMYAHLDEKDINKICDIVLK